MRPFLAWLLVSALGFAEPPELMRLGDEACAAGLWDVGALRYGQLLNDPKLPKTLKPELAIRLAEAWLRTGQPDRSLALLQETYLKSLPETYFWKAQALAASGRVAEACETLAPAAQPDAAFRSEALLTLSSLQLALDRTADALLTLKPLADSQDPRVSALARLRQAAILLDQESPRAAAEIVPAAENLPPHHRPEAALIRANIALATGKPDDAITEFAALLDNPEYQSRHQFDAAAIGLAEALAAQENPAAAAASLLSFVAEHPDSPMLDAMFARILKWLPDEPKPDDPILERLAEWIPAPPPAPPAILNARNGSAAGVWPTLPESGELAAHAIYARATGLLRIDTAAANAEARALFTRLRLEYPLHALTRRASLGHAKRLLADNQPAAAFAVIDRMQSGPSQAGEAGFLAALSAYQLGDPKQAISLFDAAAKDLDRRQAATARLNAAIIRLKQGITLPVTTNDPANAEDPATAADLRLEQALTAKDPAAAKTALDEFLTQNPGHPREPEARLAAAEAALSVQPPDLAAARAHLAAIDSADPPPANPPPPNRLALVKLRLADLSSDPKATIAAAKSFLEVFANDPAAGDVALTLGRSQYQTGDYNPARMTLEKLAKADPEGPACQAAWLLAARSAALVPSPQSREESLKLYDKAIETKGPLAAAAVLEKARLMLDLNHPTEAATFLRHWIDGLPKDDPLHLPAGLLLGEAVTLAGGDSPASLAEALAIYQKLLAHPATDPAARHRLKFLCGQTLEQLPDPKNPGAKRIPEALEAYYSVLEAATKTPPAEWEWFERCGFRALELYAEAERWQAAIAIAKKIASFNGPRAADAANQARILQLKHMVWED